MSVLLTLLLAVQGAACSAGESGLSLGVLVLLTAVRRSTVIR
jgi:hypothetical protein